MAHVWTGRNWSCEAVHQVSPFKGSQQRNESKPEVALKMSLGGWLEPVSVDFQDEVAGAARPERRWRISGRKAKRVK